MNTHDFRKEEFIRRDTKLKTGQPMKLIKTTINKERLHIVYVMTWVGICGGSKIILQHCNQLVERGHRVTIVCHFQKPNWFPLDTRVGFVQPPIGEVLCEYIPKCDLIVATYWKEIYECVEQNIAPVVYFEQGDTHLFDPEAIDAYTMEHIRKQISFAPFVFTVSSFAAKKLQDNFNVDAKVIPNAVDKNIFFPDSHAKQATRKAVISAIGSEHIAFKCITNIVVAVEILKKIGHDIEFTWISPDIPSRLTSLPVKINPGQMEIGDSLRRSDIYVCASQYESFCLPVLEAMTCGVAVVTTDCGGVNDFAKDGVNAILIKKNSIADIVEKLAFLISDTKLRDKLSASAIKTAEEFDWANITDMLISYYQDIAQYQIQ